VWVPPLNRPHGRGPFRTWVTVLLEKSNPRGWGAHGPNGGEWRRVPPTTWTPRRSEGLRLPALSSAARSAYPLFKFSTGLNRRKLRSDFEGVQGRYPTNCARSGHHRKKGVNLVRPSGDQALVVGLTLCSGL